MSAKERRVGLLAHPPEPAHAAEGELGARHLADHPAALEEEVDDGIPHRGRLAAAQHLRVLVEQAVREERDAGHGRHPSLEVQQHLAELARLLHAVERRPCLGGREDAVDERDDPP